MFMNHDLVCLFVLFFVYINIIITEYPGQWRHQKFFVGASRGQNTFLRGQKSNKLPKMADFGHFFF